MNTLYHVSGWQHLSAVQCQQEFILKPGMQCAEGIGVYFSEGAPRLSAAEGAHDCPAVCIAIEAEHANGWWQSKGGKARKFGKPRTWHSYGKSLRCRVVAISSLVVEGCTLPLLHCTWQWVEGDK